MPENKKKFYIGDPVRVFCIECQQNEIATRFVSTKGLVENIHCDECRQKYTFKSIEKLLKKFGLDKIE